ncbi:acetyl-CoA carboxylase biotin carboxylase subunit [Streptomonospora nanhaiensis]|uniref:acetyl-CoA carboxylase biotin carboxylase subunit n=1 Tax=Streptomonospora nanhaiensis TaxID=1323731 RepID=UPI001C395369|nr:biotin carboxylase N-terminal domain-containing protein [Streptomonospora nanhaiensis]MBV2365252.1 ATP-grasp domain-containing protein [Streptomonospora nanhaiensis]
MLKKVLIANRGEIAVRVARACRELGIGVVAVYSTADRDSEVVRLADDAVHVGPPPARGSYLYIPALIEAARRTGADAVHPGYGFLSEDPDFAEVCEANGLVFVGPPAGVMARLGDKTAARALMADAGLPLLPGSRSPLAGVEQARALADDIGYPVIVKAAMGGGGRGMAVVTDPADFTRSYLETVASGQTLFGDGRVYVERYLESARHVEVQVFADAHGGAVHLGERDCSVQRRHQKLVEETPAPGVPRPVVERMGEEAVRGLRAAGYVRAATVEFLTGPDGAHYFMEVNSRIQVEHPVTEMAYGVDLVREQLLAAAGEPLSAELAAARPRGAVIECRVNAEDPERGFAPAPGTLEEFTPPGGPFVRVDTHARAGMRIPAAYDSLLAKVVVWAPDRTQALARAVRALEEFRVAGAGVRTAIPFLLRVLRDPDFRAGRHDTGLVARL